MALNIRHPVWLSAEQPGANAFAALFLLESFARASLSAVIPLQVYFLFQNKETVSLVYTSLAAVTFGLNFLIPFAIHVLSRRWAYTLGAVMIAFCAALLTLGMPVAQIAAMLVRNAGAAAMSVSLNLYIMDNIRKQDFVKSEPLRLGVATLAWTAAPSLGAWLFHHYGILATASLAIGFVIPTITLFWYLRMKEGGPIRKAVIRAPNPFGQIRRFVAQPRLRMAWMIGFTRSAYWATAFVYIPILMVEGGLGPVAGGLAVSGANALLFLSLFLTPLARRFTVRRMLGWANIAAGAGIAAAAFAATQSLVAAGVILAAAAGAVTVVDGLGAIPFMRAVHVHERAEMTTVYRTYLDAASLIPQLVYFGMFQIAGYAGAFATLAAFTALTGIVCLRYLPRRL
jgi:MFS family permease